jgi:hypothetical protein
VDQPRPPDDASNADDDGNLLAPGISSFMKHRESDVQKPADAAPRFESMDKKTVQK